MKFPEFIATYILLGWGSLLLLPLDTFSTSKSYDIMETLMPETCWGYLTLIVGISLLVGNLRGNYKIRKLSLLVSSLIWAVVFSSLFLASKASTGTIAYLGYCLLSTWLHTEISKQAKGHTVGSVSDERVA